VAVVEELSPSQKGAIAEAYVTAAAMELGFVVLRPVCEGARYDLAIDLESRLLRVQCKLGRVANGAITAQLQSNRCTPSGYVARSYTVAEIDAVAVYVPDLQTAFLLPVAEVAGRRAVHLRLSAARNNQARGIRWAREYGFEDMIGRLRTVAAEPSGGEQLDLSA
jgi:hypothetical protein